MTTEEQLRNEYERIRWSLEEQEDHLKRRKRDGQQFIQETFLHVQRLLNKRGYSNVEPLQELRRELNRIEGEYIEELDSEKRVLLQQQEENEQDYRKKRQALIE